MDRHSSAYIPWSGTRVQKTSNWFMKRYMQRALKWGRTHEKDALKQVEKRLGCVIMRPKEVTRVKGVAFRPDGWIEDPELAGFKTGENPSTVEKDVTPLSARVLVEVKCPYKLRNSTDLSESFRKKKKPEFLRWDSCTETFIFNLHTPQGLQYHHQVQSSLWAAGELEQEEDAPTKCLLCVWSTYDLLLVWINKDVTWEQQHNIPWGQPARRAVRKT